MIHPRAGWFGSQLRILKLKDLFKPPVEKMNGKYFLNQALVCVLSQPCKQYFLQEIQNLVSSCSQVVLNAVRHRNRTTAVLKPSTMTSSASDTFNSAGWPILRSCLLRPGVSFIEPANFSICMKVAQCREMANPAVNKCNTD